MRIMKQSASGCAGPVPKRTEAAEYSAIPPRAWIQSVPYAVLYAELPQNERRMKHNFKQNAWTARISASFYDGTMRGLDSCMAPAAKYAKFSSLFCRHGEMAYTVDSKSAAREGVWVQVPLPAILAPFRALFLCLKIKHIINNTLCNQYYSIFTCFSAFDSLDERFTLVYPFLVELL